MEHLFINFLSSPEECDNARAYWSRLCSDAISRDRLAAWRPWLSRGTPDDRSLEIFSMWSEEIARAFVINQLSSESRNIVVGARLDTFGLNHLARPIEYMALWCELTEPAATVARELISKWSDPAIDYSAMATIIDRVN